MVLLGLFVLAAIIGPQVLPYDPNAVTPLTLKPPSAAHLLGTTQTGQDVLSQLLVGIRLTLELGLYVGVHRDRAVGAGRRDRRVPRRRLG